MKICLFGHPYTPIGMGEVLASLSRSLDAVFVKHAIYDIYGAATETNNKSRPWLIDKETSEVHSADIRIFCINGDEIEPCLGHLGSKGFDFTAGKNIIVPAWELPDYPEIWRDGINRFDEVWAMSHYVKKIFDDWAKPIVRHVGLSTQREKGVLYPRKYFAIKDSSLVFLSFFDQSSYFPRKNPLALVEFYDRLRKSFPYSDFQLVLKVKDINKESSFLLHRRDENIILINKNLSYEETTSLIDASDVFVSLHRAEGFGRGGAEAVLRKRRALLTNYSGVEDYSADPAILPVDFKMVPVKEGEYPYYEGQVWAEPDIEDAVRKAATLIEEHEQGISNQHFFSANPRAGLVVQNVASHFSVGVNILKNLSSITDR